MVTKNSSGPAPASYEVYTELIESPTKASDLTTSGLTMSEIVRHLPTQVYKPPNFEARYEKITENSNQIVSDTDFLLYDQMYAREDIFTKICARIAKAVKNHPSIPVVTALSIGSAGIGGGIAQSDDSGEMGPILDMGNYSVYSPYQDCAFTIDHIGDNDILKIDKGSAIIFDKNGNAVYWTSYVKNTTLYPDANANYAGLDNYYPGGWVEVSNIKNYIEGDLLDHLEGSARIYPGGLVEVPGIAKYQGKVISNITPENARKGTATGEGIVEVDSENSEFARVLFDGRASEVDIQLVKFGSQFRDMVDLGYWFKNNTVEEPAAYPEGGDTYAEYYPNSLAVLATIGEEGKVHGNCVGISQLYASLCPIENGDSHVEGFVTLAQGSLVGHSWCMILNDDNSNIHVNPYPSKGYPNLICEDPSEELAMYLPQSVYSSNVVVGITEFNPTSDQIYIFPKWPDKIRTVEELKEAIEGNTELYGFGDNCGTNKLYVMGSTDVNLKDFLVYSSVPN